MLAPHQFATKEQYERHIRQPIGQDWNTTTAHKEAIAPRVVAKAGKVLDPIGKQSATAGAGKDSKEQGHRPRKPVAA
ncbi:Utp14 protein-domain-containing protein [Baffinella frigidus]|nr:Utp14 protein-domain-containing protein [Cryptophyta sp. CCMP2293]